MIVIKEKSDAGLTSDKICKYLEEENITDETERFLTTRQIGGYKSFITMNAQIAEGEERTLPSKQTPPQPAPLPQAVSPPAVAVPPIVPTPPTPAAEKAKILIPRPKTRLETFVDMMERGVAQSNEGLVQIAVDGIYKEMDKNEHTGGGTDDKVWTLLTAMMKEGKGESKLDDLEKLTKIIKNMMPEQAEGKSEAVQMAEVMSDTTLKVAKEARETALEITGSKGKADTTGKCPGCSKLIPMDSLYCPYCGLAFRQDVREEEDEDEEDPEEMKMRQREEEQKKKKAGIAKRAMNRTPPQQQRPPAAQQPTPTPTSPQQQRPQAQRPGDQAITPEERANLLRNLKRLANFISSKDDPIIKTQALFKVADEDDKKNGVFLSIIGREKILASAQRLLKEHPELSEFQHYVDLCDSVDGRAYIDAMMKELQNQAKLMGVYLKKEEAAEMLAIMEARLGFAIE